MMRRLGLSLWSGAVLLTVVGLASAQRRLPAPAQPTDPPPPVPPGVAAPGAPGADGGKSADVSVPEMVPGGLRDPTRPSAKMRDVLGTKSSAGMKTSPLSLRGRIIAKNRPPAALLEIEGKLYSVGKGSVVTGAGNTVLKVLDIGIDGVRIESSPSKEIFFLR